MALIWTKPFLNILLCFVFFAYSESVKEGDIRLVGSTDKWQGRVEIFLHKTWGTICSWGWTHDHAEIVCRQLNYTLACGLYKNAEFGRGSGPVHIDGFKCTGKENRLLDCQVDRYSKNGNCKHEKDVGVVCQHSSNLPPGGCSFDKNWCGYKIADDNCLIWTKDSRLGRYSYGPDRDHTTGNRNGHYIYAKKPQAHSLGQSRTSIISPLYTGVKCIQFYYTLRDSDTKLRVLIDDGTNRTLMWEKKGEVIVWTKAMFPVENVSSLRIVFEAFIGNKYYSTVTLDDVSPLKEPCSLTKFTTQRPSARKHTN